MRNPQTASSVEPLSVSRFLTDFTPRRIPDEMLQIMEPARAPNSADAETDKLAFETIVQNERQRREAFEEGRADGRAEADALFEAERQRLQRTHDEEMATLRIVLMDEAAVAIGSSLQDGFTALEATLSQQLTNVLMPLVEDHLTGQAVFAFAHKLASVAIAAGEGNVVVKGPTKLIAALERMRSILPAHCALVEQEQAELSFELPEQVLQTRLRPLLEELKVTVL